MLQVKKMHLEIGQKKILTDLSCSLKSNQIVSLVGPNGAGKSTLLRVLCGVLSKWSGEVLYGDKNLNSFNEKELARVFALVSAFTPALNGFTMSDLLNFSRYPYMGIYRGLTEEEKDFKNKLIHDFKIESFQERDLVTLSSGEMQRVLLACAFFQDPSVLLVDEALSNLDPKYKVEIHQQFKSWVREDNRIVFYITHDLNEAINISDHLIVMSNGTIAFEGTPTELLATNILEEVYQIKFKHFVDQEKQFLFPVGDLR